MEINLKSSQSLMKAIKKMHTLVESPDVEKQGITGKYKRHFLKEQRHEI
mgnify:CR=1 FL=1